MRKLLLFLVATVAIMCAVPSVARAMDSTAVANTRMGWFNLPRTERMDRSGKLGTFIPAGNIIVGGTVSYSSLNSSDYKFLLLDNITLKGQSTNATLFGAYTFTNNVAAGLSLKYSRSLAKIDQFDLSLGEDMSFGVSNYFNIQQSFTATAFLRTYITIGRQRRIGMYNDVEVYFGGGTGKNTSGVGADLSGTYQKLTSVGLLLSPGIVVFATDFMSVEAGLSIFGIEYMRSEQISNQVYLGSYESFTASFKLNLLKINLGLSFYF